MEKLKAMCSSCKKISILESESILRYTNEDSNTITYFKCKHCGFCKCVQIDNEETKNLLKHQTTLLYAASKSEDSQAKRRNKDVFTNVDVTLRALRKELMNKYKGTMQQNKLNGDVIIV